MASEHHPKPIDTKRWKQRDHNVKIEEYIVTAVKMPGVFDPKDRNKQLIHWRGGGAYEVGKEWHSTSYDTRKWSEKDPEIEVQVISKDFRVSSTAAGSWSTHLAKECTTTHVYDLLVAKKFNHYLYNGNGSGCLTWTVALTELLENEGIIPKGSKNKLLEEVDRLRKDPKCWVPDEPGAQFYN